MTNVFNEEEEVQLIRDRYKNVSERFPLTLSRLRGSNEFHRVYDKCKEAGLKDWHILQAIANATINYRLNYNRGAKSFDEMRQRFMDKFFSVETDEDVVVPISEYTYDNIQLGVNLALTSYLVQHGHVVKRQTPNFKRLREFADTQYQYFQLDVEHEAFF